MDKFILMVVGALAFGCVGESVEDAPFDKNTLPSFCDVRDAEALSCPKRTPVSCMAAWSSIRDSRALDRCEMYEGGGNDAKPNDLAVARFCC